ncbi:unnamed protein product [Miscanthus lutarioriparius]|uniref:Uncharacterized protein n=1 Tax=Miscanthus lutarioriparius TaxID=422564 RepID=A0A811MSW1_9POAL|nr:unnamed protein product [Miscanthus lutarioriparius]
MAPPPPSPSPSPALPATAQAPPATFTSPASGKDAASSPSALSPDAEPFFPGARSAGRGKSQRWEMDSYDSDTDFDYSSPEAASYLDVARRGCEAVSTGRAGAQPDSQGPGETAAEASHCAPTKTQSRRRARAAARRGTGRATATQRVPATQRIGPQAAERVPAHRRLGPQRRATPPDANGWQKVLLRDEGRPPPRASQRQSQSQPGHRIPPEFAGRCLNCLSHDPVVATPSPDQKAESAQQRAASLKRPRQAKRQEATPTRPEIAKRRQPLAATKMRTHWDIAPHPTHGRRLDAQEAVATDEQLGTSGHQSPDSRAEIPEAAADDVTTEADGGDRTATADEAIAIPQPVQIQIKAVSGDPVVDDIDDGPLAAEEAAKAKDAATSTQGDRTQAEGGPDKSPLSPTHEGEHLGPTPTRPMRPVEAVQPPKAIDANRSIAHQSPPWDGTVPDGEQGAITPPVNRPERTTPSPPKDTASAQRRFKSFTVKVKRPKAAGAIKRPSLHKAAKCPRKGRRWPEDRAVVCRGFRRQAWGVFGAQTPLGTLPHSPHPSPEQIDAFVRNNPEDDEALQELFGRWPHRMPQEARRRRWLKNFASMADNNNG